VVPAGETACGYASYLVARPDRLRSDAITIPEHDRLVPGLSWGLTGPRPPAYLRMCGSQKTYRGKVRTLVAMLMQEFRVLPTADRTLRKCGLCSSSKGCGAARSSAPPHTGLMSLDRIRLWPQMQPECASAASFAASRRCDQGCGVLTRLRTAWPLVPGARGFACLQSARGTPVRPA